MDPLVQAALAQSKAYHWGHLQPLLLRWMDRPENPFTTTLPGTRSPQDVFQTLYQADWEWVVSRYPLPYRAYRSRLLCQGGVVPLLRIPHPVRLEARDLGGGYLEACLPEGWWAERETADRVTLLVGPVDHRGDEPVLGALQLWAGDPPLHGLSTRLDRYFDQTMTVGTARAMGARAAHLLRRHHG